MNNTEVETVMNYKCPSCGKGSRITAAEGWRNTTYDNGDFDIWGWCRLDCGHKFGFNEYSVLTNPDFRFGKEIID